MSADADSWETADHDLAALSLKPPPPPPPAARPAAAGRGTGRASFGSLEAAVAAAREAPPEEPIDAFLRDALQRGGGDRLIVLKLDVDCEKLVRAPRRDRFSLSGPLSAFQRQAARKVAAHYGLAVEPSPEDSGVALCRTGATRLPTARLQDVPGPRPAPDDDAGLGLGAGAADAGPPRVVGVMRRSPSASGASDARAPAQTATLSVEEREAAYERARERILGAATADAPAVDDAAATQPPPQAQPSSDGGAVSAAAERDAADARRAPPPPGGAAAGGGGSAQRRAVMRDREKDLADPDFARRAPPLMGPYAAAGAGPYFAPAPYGDAPYGYAPGPVAGAMGAEFPPLGAALGGGGGGVGGGRWSGGGGYGPPHGGGGGYWPPLGAGGAPPGPPPGQYAYGGARAAAGGYGAYGAPQGRGGAPQGHDRGGW